MMPFALVQPSLAASVLADTEALASQKERVQLFFSQRGIDIAPDPNATVTTNMTSEATSTQTSLPAGGDSDERTDSNIDSWD